MENIALQRARDEYAAVGTRYVGTLADKGLVFAPAHRDDVACAQAREELAARGARIRNAGASIVVGHLSPACVACTASDGSETFSTTFKCHRDCYFCFNKNQPDYERFFREGCPWEERIVASQAENGRLAAVGLTGGEPLLDIDDSVRFLERARELFPDAHKRMYTSGDLLTEEMATRLRAAGLDEIRFSVKDDDAPEQQARVLAAMRVAKQHIPSVMVEMPIVPGAEEAMRQLLREFDAIGIDGINMLEFCFPFCNWPEFEKRGLALKNPPFDVMYDYGYSGGLAVAGSELAILRLMLWALDEGLSLGMHYCSLDNKHRSEVRIKNERAREVLPGFTFDEGDFFLKMGKVFGCDVDVARRVLASAGCTDMREDADEESLTFPLAFAPALLGVTRADGTPIELQICSYVYECDEEGGYLVDVALEYYIPV